ncbi:hypothetical protein NVP1031O_081 [Vibrio phage 1.031.O._10N.261.46.F8]|nr:hypothetical protein NVP1031O_081 [Vibrio phage 1.031.O._10N.261.46.F8]
MEYYDPDTFQWRDGDAAILINSQTKRMVRSNSVPRPALTVNFDKNGQRYNLRVTKVMGGDYLVSDEWDDLIVRPVDK